MPPKMGLLGYVLETDLSDRDVVFVPVAINYDRVLEDRVLIAADQAGTRRFKARISVILFFILRKTWLRISGKFLRFGEAAVVFGEPVPLRDYGPDPDVDHVAQDLMARIASEMPLLFVPLMAHALVATTGPLTATALDAEIARLVEHAKTVIDVPHDDFSDAIAKAREHLLQRGMIRVDTGEVTVVPDQRPALTFYANSIAHFFEE